MSLIGPRPERPAFCAEFEKRIHGWHYRTMVTPGLSGLAQVTGGYDLLPKEKVVLDLWRALLMEGRLLEEKGFRSRFCVVKAKEQFGLRAVLRMLHRACRVLSVQKMM